MARRRYLSTEISIDKAVNRLAREHGDFAALLYTWMIPHAEDDATLTGDPEELMLSVVPGRRDKDVADVEAALAAMHDLGLIIWHREAKIVEFPPASFYKYQTYIPKGKRRSAPISDDQRETPQIGDDDRAPAPTAASPSPSLSPIDHHHPPAHAREEPADSGQPSQRWTDWYEQRTACSVSRTMYEAITEIQQRGGITDELVIATLERAIADRARDPLTYAKRLLGNCALYGLRTRAEWEAWERERAAAEEERKLAVVQHRIRAPTVREVHPINEFDFSDFDDAG